MVDEVFVCRMLAGVRTLHVQELSTSYHTWMSGRAFPVWPIAAIGTGDLVSSREVM